MRILLIAKETQIDLNCLNEITIRFPHVDVKSFDHVENAIAASPKYGPVLVCACREALTGDSIHVLRHIQSRLPGATVVVIRTVADLMPLVSLFAADTVTPAEPAKRRAMPLAGLTERENAVMLLLSQGLQNKMIARRLDLSVSTVKTHVANIFRKIGVCTRLDAICKFAEARHEAAETPQPMLQGFGRHLPWPLMDARAA